MTYNIGRKGDIVYNGDNCSNHKSENKGKRNCQKKIFDSTPICYGRIIYKYMSCSNTLITLITNNTGKERFNKS